MFARTNRKKKECIPCEFLKSVVFFILLKPLVFFVLNAWIFQLLSCVVLVCLLVVFMFLVYGCPFIVEAPQ
jgi:hypothetical protein